MAGMCVLVGLGSGFWAFDFGILCRVVGLYCRHVVGLCLLVISDA